MTYLPPGLPKEAYERMERWERHRTTVYAKAAALLAPKLDGVDPAAVVKVMEGLESTFCMYQMDSESVEPAAQSKRDLLTLAKKAEELASFMCSLGMGAVTVMNRPTVRQDLYQDAEPFNLPDPDTHGPGHLCGATDEENRQHQEEWWKGGLWVIRLRALAELARMKAERIARQTAKGGRISFSARLGKEPPDEWLARACKDYVEAHGCPSQAVILKMVQAIQEAEKGQKINASAGRAAVRKLV